LSGAQFLFRSLSNGEVEAVGKLEGVPEQIAQLLVAEAARQVQTPGLWQGTMQRADDQTQIDLARLGDETQAVAVVRARQAGGQVEIDTAFVDGGAHPALASTQALASAAAHELADLPQGDWHRLVLLLEPRT